MTYTATITSKRQLTIPAKLFKKLKLKVGEKVTITKTPTGIAIQSDEAILDSLKGSVKVPKHLKGRDLDEIIEEGKEMYFKEKYSKRLK